MAEQDSLYHKVIDDLYEQVVDPDRPRGSQFDYCEALTRASEGDELVEDEPDFYDFEN